MNHLFDDIQDIIETQYYAIERINELFLNVDVSKCESYVKAIDHVRPWIIPDDGFVIIDEEVSDSIKDTVILTINDVAITLDKYIRSAPVKPVTEDITPYHERRLRNTTSDLSLCDTDLIDELHRSPYYVKKGDVIKVNEHATVLLPYVYNVKFPKSTPWNNEIFTISEHRLDNFNGILLYFNAEEEHKFKEFENAEFFMVLDNWEYEWQSTTAPNAVLAKLPYDIETPPNMTKLYYKVDRVPVIIE